MVNYKKELGLDTSGAKVKEIVKTETFLQVIKKDNGKYSNLLFDSIDRVARDPIRKLSKDNRIVLSLKMCLFNKNLPHNIATGAKAALLYNNIKDAESKVLISLRKKLGDSEVLEKICGIEKLDPLNNLILSKKINNLK